jgi:hypothetical protein
MDGWRCIRVPLWCSRPIYRAQGGQKRHVADGRGGDAMATRMHGWGTNLGVKEIFRTRERLEEVLGSSAASGAYLSLTRTASTGLVAVALASERKKKLFFFLFEGVRCLG